MQLDCVHRVVLYGLESGGMIQIAEYFCLYEFPLLFEAWGQIGRACSPGVALLGRGGAAARSEQA